MCLDEKEFAEEVFQRACKDEKCRQIAEAGVDPTKRIEKIAKLVCSRAFWEVLQNSEIDEIIKIRCYEELGYYIYRVAYNYLLKKHCPIDLAEDCAQEALERIYKYRKTINPDTFLGFAITVTNRICAHAVETISKQGEDLDDEFGELELLKSIDPYLLECWLEAFARLPNKDMRMVLILEYFAEFKDKAIATLLGTTRNNVTQLRFRAIKKLRNDQALAECLADYLTEL